MQAVAKFLITYCAIPYFRLVLGLMFLIIAPFHLSLTAIEGTRRAVTAGIRRTKAGRSPAPVLQSH